MKEQYKEMLYGVGNWDFVHEIEKIIDFGEDEELFHINIYKLADEWGVSRRSILDFFLNGVKVGLFDIQWEFHCPGCGGVARETIKLSETKSEDHCPGCDIDFKNSLDENVEIFFNINDGVRTIPNGVKSRYNEFIMHDITHSKKFEWKNQYTISGLDAISNPVFASLFGNDTIPFDQSLEIKHSTILFTDIKGSTAMYERLGDSKAFSMVSEHFNLLFNQIIDNGGLPVKTMGDAVMGVFKSESDALHAAFEAQREITAYYGDRDEAERIEIKIGIHSGPVIVVTLNGRLDYFGTTVNMASRIQNLASSGEVVFSERIYNSKENLRVIASFTDRLVRSVVKLKGLSGEFSVYRGEIR